ncbi:ribonuclease E inhibitor RraB [Shewanella algae]|uniref:ribonuclease E inhibitor RraB n=1 Tax=Shewanella algae TaxID=38313 RepID=UPI0030068793
MSIVEALLDNAYQDSQLLEGNDHKGDIFSVSRDVDFLLYAPDQDKGELVANFINDNCYGEASYYAYEDKHCIKVVIHMPTTQNILNSVSGLMTCIAKIFDCEYDGWGCVLQTHNKVRHARFAGLRKLRLLRPCARR